MTGNKFTRANVAFLVLGMAFQLRAQPHAGELPSETEALSSRDETVARRLISSQSVSQLERVEWSGVRLLGWKIFGRWRVVPEGGSYFLGLYTGSRSPYFRLNGDNRTIFRALGRENGFMQLLFPSWHPRKISYDLLGGGESLQLLNSFDSQLSTGEHVYTAGSAVAFLGEAMFYTGLFLAPATGSVSPLKRLSIPGLVLYAVGSVGRLVGYIVQDKAFGFLDDAVQAFNRSHKSRPPKVSRGS